MGQWVLCLQPSIMDKAEAKYHIVALKICLVAAVRVLIDLAISEVYVLRLDGLHRPAVVTRTPAHDLHAPVINL